MRKQNSGRDDYNNSCGIVVMQHKKCSNINILINCIDWKIARIIWIGFYKNDRNEKCFISHLGKDIVLFILRYLGNHVAMIDKSGLRTSCVTKPSIIL